MRTQDIPNYPDYAVTDDGRVFSKRRNIFLRPLIDRNGRLTVLVCVKNIRKTFALARLVADAFVKNNKPSEFTIILHKDGNKSNNHFRNLRWARHDERAHRAYGEKWHRAKLDNHEVAAIRKAYSTGKVTYRDLSNRYGVTVSQIGHIINHRSRIND